MTGRLFEHLSQFLLSFDSRSLVLGFCWKENSKWSDTSFCFYFSDVLETYCQPHNALDSKRYIYFHEWIYDNDWIRELKVQNMNMTIRLFCYSFAALSSFKAHSPMRNSLEQQGRLAKGLQSFCLYAKHCILSTFLKMQCGNPPKSLSKIAKRLQVLAKHRKSC